MSKVCGQGTILRKEVAVVAVVAVVTTGVEACNPQD